MLNYNIYEILLKVANRYNLELKYHYDSEYYNHFLVEEQKSVFINHFVERMYSNRLYVDVTPSYVYFEIHSNGDRLCRCSTKIYKKTEVVVILKKIEQYLRDCHDYCDFLYNLATILRQMG